MSGLLFYHNPATTGGGSLTPDFGTGWTTALDPGTGAFEADGDALRWSLGVLEAKAIVTIDDEPAANSRVAMMFVTEFETINADDPLYFVARYTDNDNFYLLGGYNDTAAGKGISIQKNVGGTLTELARDNTANMNAVDRYAIDVSDSTKKIFRDEVEIISTTDNALTSGKYGLAWGNFELSTDDIGDEWRIDAVVLVEIDSGTKVVDYLSSLTTRDPINGNHTPTIEGTAWVVEITGLDNAFIFGSTDDGSWLAMSQADQFSSANAYSVTPDPTINDQEMWMAWNLRDVNEGTGDEYLGPILRFTDVDDYYFFAIVPSTNDLKLIRRDGGVATELAATTDPSPPVGGGGLLYAKATDAEKLMTYYPNPQEAGGTGSPPWTLSSSDDSVTEVGKWGLGSGNLTGTVDDDIPGDNNNIRCIVCREVAPPPAPAAAGFHIFEVTRPLEFPG